MAVAADFGILNRAYSAPLREAGSVLRIFWPFLVCFEVPSQIMQFDTNAPGAITSFQALITGAMFFLSFPLFAFGAIKWHRRLALDEADNGAAVSPPANSRHYVATMIGIGVGSALATLPVLLAISYFGRGIIDPRDTPIAAVLMLGLVDFAVVMLLYEFVLLLPIFAIEPADKAKAMSLNRQRPCAGWRATLLFGTLPITVVITTLTSRYSLNPEVARTGNLPEAIGGAVQALVGDGLTFYGALVFIGVLSLWYAKYERSRILALVPATP